jgi:hypothetical protein
MNFLAVPLGTLATVLIFLTGTAVLVLTAASRARSRQLAAHSSARR